MDISDRQRDIVVLMMSDGRIAQLVERQSYILDVGGSSPSVPTWRNYHDHDRC